MSGQKQDSFAGGSPATGYFFWLRQNKVTKEKATPVCRPFWAPSISRKQAEKGEVHKEPFPLCLATYQSFTCSNLPLPLKFHLT